MASDLKRSEAETGGYQRLAIINSEESYPRLTEQNMLVKTSLEQKELSMSAGCKCMISCLKRRTKKTNTER